MFRPKSHRPSGLFRRILDWILDRDDEALMEERRRRLWSAAGIRSLLNPEALEMMRNGEEPERSGGPAPERRR
jgi:hypothetical protein